MYDTWKWSTTTNNEINVRQPFIFAFNASLSVSNNCKWEWESAIRSFPWNSNSRRQKLLLLSKSPKMRLLHVRIENTGNKLSKQTIFRLHRWSGSFANYFNKNNPARTSEWFMERVLCMQFLLIFRLGRFVLSHLHRVKTCLFPFDILPPRVASHIVVVVVVRDKYVVI